MLSANLALSSLLRSFISWKRNMVNTALLYIQIQSSHQPTRFGVDVDKATALAVPGAHAPPPGITFDRFVRACVVVRTLTETFNKLAKPKDGPPAYDRAGQPAVLLSYDDFMRTVLSAP